ncbi:ferredoxin [Nocardia tenerifensis]|uniref:Ferredoxin n=1 Tax=Nocardia tenerifensis TaxID=228006 RepID=A0A318KGA8_9NOCA|nr:(4Fe-4S)-binding protein [Nocardia tenerifensis]PXX71292.1 ferredoxin [Nocardia tenerifensis]
MRITADRNVCIGAGLCALTAPEVFDQSDEDGLVHLLDPTATTPAAREAIQICPSGALTLTD